MIWERQFHSANLTKRFVMGNVFIKQAVVRAIQIGGEVKMTALIISIIALVISIVGAILNSKR